MKMRDLIFVGTFFSAGVLCSFAAIAGQTQSQPVVITLNTDKSGVAIGALSSVRNTVNRVELIGCGLRLGSSSTGTSRYGWCQANNSAGVNVFCSIENSDLLNAISGISDYSFLTFAWNAAGTCTRIGFSTQSIYIP